MGSFDLWLLSICSRETRHYRKDAVFLGVRPREEKSTATGHDLDVFAAKCRRGHQTVSASGLAKLYWGSLYCRFQNRTHGAKGRAVTNAEPEYQIGTAISKTAPSTLKL